MHDLKEVCHAMRVIAGTIHNIAYESGLPQTFLITAISELFYPEVLPVEPIMTAVPTSPSA